MKDRQRPLRETLRVPYGVQRLAVTPEESESIISQARRRARTHNAGRRHVEQLLFEALSRRTRDDDGADVVRERTRKDPLVREALERMWPVLTPAELLNDLFGSPGLLRSAAQRHLERSEWQLLRRERRSDATEMVFIELV